MMLSTALTLGNAKSLWAAGNVQSWCGLVKVSPSVQRYYKGSGSNGIDCSRGTHDPDEESLVCVTNTYVLNKFVRDFCQRDEEATSAYYKLVHSLYPCCQNQ